MSVFRAFIPIKLPDEIRDRLDQVISHLQESLIDVPIRWVPAANIHLTLKFLGDVSSANYEVLTKILQVEAAAHRPFEFSIGSLGAYPNLRRPRVIWVGIEAPNELKMLQRSIDVETARLGYSSDNRRFSPHLTLGRVSRNASPRDIQAISKVLSKSEVGFLGVARVEEIHLYRSELKPGGAVYSRLFSAPLGLVDP
jgi:2'-5' RNA ligase